MRPIDIDFAPRSLRRLLWRTPAATWAACAVALLLLGGAAWQGRPASGPTETLRRELATVQKRLAQAQAQARARAEPAGLAADQPALQAVTQDLNRPWNALLDALAAAAGNDTAWLELDVDPVRHRLQGLVEARSAAAMLAHLERLKQQPALDGVWLQHHEPANREAGGPAVRYAFEAAWVEAGK